MNLQSCKCDIKKHQVWFHFPFYLGKDPNFGDFSLQWKLQSPEDLGNFDRRSYFHKFVADQLFGDPNDPTKGPDFETYKRVMKGNCNLGADKIHTGNAKYWITRFHLEIADCELRILGSGSYQNGGQYKGIAVASVKVNIIGVSETSRHDTVEQAWAAEFTTKPYTLTDAMCASDWIRRVYPRWWLTPGIPGDSISRVVNLSTGAPIMVEADEITQDGSIEAALLPWITELLRPIKFKGTNAIARIKGDERTYMSSLIAIKPDAQFKDNDEFKEAKTIAMISTGDLLRLAEADPKAVDDPDDNYSPEFTKSLKGQVFYDRHAPHVKTSKFRSTRWLITAQHLCAIGCGDFATNDEDLPRHFSDFYRHMHFLCVFEQFRLLQFSEDLSELVRTYRDIKDPLSTAGNTEYITRLSEIRQDFLTHTHLHHFSNVSSQLQGKEMFERLYSAFSIKELHEEVEQEFATASDFAETFHARTQTESSDRLNQILSLGVPVGLGLALSALWLDFTASAGAELPVWYGAITNTLWGLLMQIGAITAATMAVWVIAAWFYGGRKDWNFREILLILVLCVAVATAGCLGGIRPEPSPGVENAVGKDVSR